MAKLSQEKDNIIDRLIDVIFCFDIDEMICKKALHCRSDKYTGMEKENRENIRQGCKQCIITVLMDHPEIAKRKD